MKKIKNKTKGKRIVKVEKKDGKQEEQKAQKSKTQEKVKGK